MIYYFCHFGLFLFWGHSYPGSMYRIPETISTQSAGFHKRGFKIQPGNMLACYAHFQYHRTGVSDTPILNHHEQLYPTLIVSVSKFIQTHPYVDQKSPCSLHANQQILGFYTRSSSPLKTSPRGPLSGTSSSQQDIRKNCVPGGSLMWEIFPNAPGMEYVPTFES